MTSAITGMLDTGCSGTGATGAGSLLGSTRASQGESMILSSVARSASAGMSIDWMSIFASTEISHHAEFEKSRNWAAECRPLESSKGR
jgi:hypothetical protein